jgi:ribulose bisphosphate carboxylase small subunit
MSGLSILEAKEIKTLISQTKALEKTIKEILTGEGQEHAKYTAFKDMAHIYNDLANQAKRVLKIGYFYTMNTDEMKSWSATVWPMQKSILENVLVSTRMLISTLESNIDFIGEEIDNVENFIRTKLRPVIYNTPVKEKEIQNGIETLFIGKGYGKGIDYDRETGKFNYSGREYIPDFILPKLRMCIEVKLLKDASHKSKVIEEINADITAYSKEYENLLFVIYDIGSIRDEVEFCRDIENNDGVKIVIVKH